LIMYLFCDSFINTYVKAYIKRLYGEQQSNFKNNQ
jgi:hypothetical protein